MMKIGRWGMLLAACLVLLAAACGDDGETRSEKDAVADDDAADDDAADDDSAVDGDDDDDDDTAPSEPMRLLVTGRTRIDYTLGSWVQTDDGWLKLDVPQQGPPDNMGYEVFGPIVVRDGRNGYAAINRLEAYGKSKALYYRRSFDYTWLSFDLETGWETTERPPYAYGEANIRLVQAPAANDLWSVAEFFYSEADNGIPFGHSRRFFFDDLVHYGGPNGGRERRVIYQSITALSVPEADRGLAWVTKLTGDELWSFDGASWNVVATPAAFADAHLDWLWLTDPDAGYALGYDDDGARMVFEQIDGDWVRVTPPAGCETPVPKALFAVGDYAIGVGHSLPAPRVWEKRGGQWQCRDLEAVIGGWYGSHAVATADGRAFLAVNVSYLAPKLLELTADTVEKIALPLALGEIQSVHVLGEGAPPLSYAVGEEYW